MKLQSYTVPVYFDRLIGNRCSIDLILLCYFLLLPIHRYFSGYKNVLEILTNIYVLVINVDKTIVMNDV